MRLPWPGGVAASASQSGPDTAIARRFALAGSTGYNLRAMSIDVRWKQRLTNFNRAFALLREALANGPSALSALEKEGAIQRFECTFELAWKVLNDYLEAEGATVVPLPPRQVIKEAFAAKLLTDGQTWIDMLDQRNLLSHNYDERVFADAVNHVAQRFLPALAELHAWFAQKVVP